MTTDGPRGSDTPAPHRGRAVGRAALACGLVTVAGLVIVAIGFALIALGGSSQTQEFSWIFALYVLPSVVTITVLLIVAAAVLGIVGIVQAGGQDRRPAIVGVAIAVVVLLIYVAGTIILGALLSPHVTG